MSASAASPVYICKGIFGGQEMAQKRSKGSSDKKGKVTIGVGTTQGGYLLVADSHRSKWKKVGPFLRKESVNCLRYDPKSKTLFAATHTNGVFASRDFGKNWVQRNDGLHIKKTWTLEVDPAHKNTVYLGTHYGHLFKSSDLGKNWEEVTGLFDAPRRNEWGIDWSFGTVGLCIHTIRMDPKKKDHMFIVSSGMGPYRSEDGGQNWSLLDSGVKNTCDADWARMDTGRTGETDPDKLLQAHLRDVHKCTHKLTISSQNPGLVYQQNHCGVYKSTDFGKSWSDISPSKTLRHGFPIALAETHNDANGGTLFIIPSVQGEPCDKHNSCIKGEVAVYRSKDGGRDWERLTKGLPKKKHTAVLRDAMALDAQETPGVYFGTTTGEVYYSGDMGEKWSKIFDGAGRIQGVSSFSA